MKTNRPVNNIENWENKGATLLTQIKRSQLLAWQIYYCKIKVTS